MSFSTCFIAGFISAAPSCYIFEKDCATEDPWCAPWYWSEEWFDADKTPYEMGKAWALLVYKEIEAAQDE